MYIYIYIYTDIHTYMLHICRYIYVRTYTMLSPRHIFDVLLVLCFVLFLSNPTGNTSTSVFDTYQQRPANFGQSLSKFSISSSRSCTSGYSSEQMCMWKFLSSSTSMILARIASATFFKVSCWSGLGQSQLDRGMRQYKLLHARE